MNSFAMLSKKKKGPIGKTNCLQKIREHAETRREAALKDSWLEGEKADLLGFIDFGHLAQIVIAKWDYFKDIVPTQHWLKQRMDEMEKARNFSLTIVCCCQVNSKGYTCTLPIGTA